MFQVKYRQFYACEEVIKTMGVTILRIGHRYVRDYRVTTHLFLVARAFGASCVIYTGQQDKGIDAEVAKIIENWGGSFNIEYADSWEKVVKDWKDNGGEVIHLTMYGLPLQDMIGKIRLSKSEKLVAVGGAKVPGIMYKLADWNVAITSQPHSEIAALSVFLHEFFEGKELSKSFQNAKLVIIPQASGKKMIKRS